MFSFFLGIWSVEEKVYLVGRETFLSFLRGEKKLLKKKNKLAKGYMTQGGLLAIVLVCEPAFCLNPCRAANSCGLGISDLGCLSSLWWTASHYCHTPWVCLMWAGYKYLKKKKKNSLQWCSLHFYSWILSPNFYSLSSIWGFIKHHKLELSFTGKQDDLISMGLPLLHQITFLLWASWSPQLWLWLSSQSGDRRSPVQLTLCIMVGFFFLFFQRESMRKVLSPGIFFQFYLIAETAKCNPLSAEPLSIIYMQEATKFEGEMAPNPGTSAHSITQPCKHRSCGSDSIKGY